MSSLPVVVIAEQILAAADRKSVVFREVLAAGMPKPNLSREMTLDSREFHPQARTNLLGRGLYRIRCSVTVGIRAGAGPLVALCSLVTVDLCVLMSEAEYGASFDAAEDEEEDGATCCPACGEGPAPLN
jgi:hypothetical protein